MNNKKVKAKIIYADGTERTAKMSADSAKNLVGNAYMNDENQIKKIEIEYIEDTAYKFRALITGLSTGITALYQRINTLRAMEIEGTLPAADVKEMIEQNEAAIRECKIYRDHVAEILHTAEKLEAEYDQVTISEDGTLISCVNKKR